MNTYKLSNVSLSQFRRFLIDMGCICISTEGGHEKWRKERCLRSVILQTHIEPVPEFIVKNTRQLASVAGRNPFQSPSCLLSCNPPHDFASVTWDKKASRCSFAGGKALLPSLDYEGLSAALAEAEGRFRSCQAGGVPSQEE